MQKQKLYLLISLSFLIVVIFTFIFYNFSLDIEKLIKTTNSDNEVDTLLYHKPVIYIGVVSRYPPNIIYRGYQPVLDYLTSKTKYRFELKLSSDYNEAVEMLVTNKVSAAFIGSYVYTIAHSSFGIIPILKPLNENNQPFARSVLIAKINSGINSIKDIKHKRLALPSKESFSANWLINKELKNNKIKLTDMEEVQNFPHHQSVIYQVAKGIYDIGVTREYLVTPQIKEKVKIILYSDPIPTSPLVVAPNYDKELVLQIKKAFLELSKNGNNRQKITKGWDNEFIFGFTEAKDSDYNIIREINKN